MLGGSISLPDRWNPWAPLWPQEAPNALTRWKLARLAGDAPACRATLAASTLVFEAEPDRPLDDGCGWAGAVRVRALPARVGAPFVLTCPAALSLALWERHTLQPLALEHFGSRVVALRHAGSYACRDIAGSHGRRSEHAAANALDVTGFTLADGRTIGVAANWNPAERSGSGDARSRFLHAVRDGACDTWITVLSPDYNAAHRDHLHLDRGTWRLCR